MDQHVTLESLLEMSEDQVSRLIQRYGVLDQDIHKLNSALRNLKLWTGERDVILKKRLQYLVVINIYEELR